MTDAGLMINRRLQMSTDVPRRGVLDHSPTAEGLLNHARRDPSSSAAVEDGKQRLGLLVQLQRARATRGLTQRKVAKLMKAAQSAVSDLETGRTEPQLRTVQRYARAVGGELTWRLVNSAGHTATPEGGFEGNTDAMQVRQITPGRSPGIDSGALVASPTRDSLIAHATRNTASTWAVEDDVKRLGLLVMLQKIRREMGLSQQQLADKMGTTQSAISELETGRVDPQLKTIHRYVRTLGLELLWRLDDARVDCIGIKAMLDQSPDTFLSPVLTTLVRENEEHHRTLEALTAALTPLPERWVNRFLECLEEGGWARSTGQGRTKTYTLKDSVANLIGVSLHRDRVLGVLIDMAGNVLDRRHAKIANSSVDDVLASAVRVVSDLYHKSSSGVLGVGVSVAGVVTDDQGVIRFAPALQAPHVTWNDVPFEGRLQEILRSTLSPELRVVVENDVNALSIWEYLREGPNTLATVLLSGVGIGCATVVDGRLIHGAHCSAGEIGHIIVQQDGPPCRLGLDHRGCLETVASAEGILSALELDGGDRTSLISGLTEANRRLGDGNAKVRAVFYAAGEHLGSVIDKYIAFVDPEKIAIYAHPQFANPAEYATAEVFQAGVSNALAGVSRDLESLAAWQTSIEWRPLQERSRARAAAEAAFWHFLRKPTRWAPTLLEPVTTPQVLARMT